MSHPTDCPALSEQCQGGGKGGRKRRRDLTVIIVEGVYQAIVLDEGDLDWL